MEFTIYNELLIALGNCLRITRRHILAFIMLAELTLAARHACTIQVTEARNASREILRRRRLQNRKKSNGHK
jgi:hypothetical protein